jgi:hypothetical protein
MHSVAHMPGQYVFHCSTELWGCYYPAHYRVWATRWTQVPPQFVLYVNYIVLLFDAEHVLVLGNQNVLLMNLITLSANLVFFLCKFLMGTLQSPSHLESILVMGIHQRIGCSVELLY